MIFLYNFFTPYYSDDLNYLLQVQGDNSLFDLMKMAFNVYIEYNPRIIGHFNTYLAANMDTNLFNIINSIIFVLMIFLIYINAVFGDKKRNAPFTPFLFLFSLFFFWRYAVDFGDTILWLSGAASYLWPMTVMLAFITYYRYLLKADEINYKPVNYPALFFLAVLAGWSNENTSGGTILLILIFTVIRFKELHSSNRQICTSDPKIANAGKAARIRPEMIIAPLGALCGFTGLLLSPGAYNRLEYFEEEYTGFVGLFSRLYKCFVTINELFFELLVIFIIVTIIAVVVKKKWHQVVTQVLPFFITGIATCFVLILIPQVTARAYFGAGVFLIIACLRAFVLLFDQSDRKNKAYSYIIFAVISLWLFFDYQSNLVNLARINREENERVAIITEAKKNNEDTAIVPKYREVFSNRYSNVHKNDMTGDPGYWINSYYRNYYDVENIIAVPRDIWDEYYSGE